MRSALLLVFSVLAVQLACAASPLAPAAADGPLERLPYTPGLDVTSMDRTADPCVDFYQYACGGWMKNNPIPADQARWDVYGKLAQDNQRFLWGILEEPCASQPDGRTAPAAEDRRLLRRLHGRGRDRGARRRAA